MRFQEEDENVKSLRTTDDARRTTDENGRQHVAHSSLRLRWAKNGGSGACSSCKCGAPERASSPGGGGGALTIMSHRYVPLWRPPFSVFSSRSHDDMRFYLTAPRFASDSLPRYIQKNYAQARCPGQACSLASVILPLRHSLFSLAAS